MRLSQIRCLIKHARIALAILVSCAGCAVQLSEVPVQQATQYQLCQCEGGLCVALDPFFEKERVKESFGVDLLSKGILPVLLVAENKGADKHFLLQKSLFSLENSATTSLKMSSDAPHVKGEDEIVGQAAVGTSFASVLGTQMWVSASEAAATSSWASSGGTMAGASTASVAAAGAALVVMPAMFALDAKMYVDAQRVRQNLIKSELKEGVLSPGQSQYGFLYFKLPEENFIKSISAIQLKVTNLHTHEMITFVFPVK